MRALRIALVLALTAGATASLLDQSAFARGTGGNGGGAAGAAGGGASGGGGGAGAGSNPNLVPTLQAVREPQPPRYARPIRAPSGDSCYKHEYLYDRFGYPVFDAHTECLQ